MTINKIHKAMQASADRPEAMQELRDMLYTMWSFGLLTGSTYEELLEYADDLEVKAGTAVVWTVHCNSSRRG